MIAVPDERFPVAWSGRTAVVTATGEVDLTNADGLRNALLSALDAGAVGLVADLSTVTFLDSAGVTALVRASRRSRAGDVTFRLAAAAPPVRRVLNLVGIDRLVEVYPNAAAALASLSDQTGRGLPA